jgi:hypothetical protein
MTLPRTGWVNYEVEDEDGLPVAIPVHTGWVVDVIHEGWTAWAHSPNEEEGVSETAASKDEAIANLRKRMRDWMYR